MSDKPEIIGDSFNRAQVLEMARRMEVTPEEREAEIRLLMAVAKLGAHWRKEDERAARKADLARALVFVAPFVILMWLLALSVAS